MRVSTFLAAASMALPTWAVSVGAQDLTPGTPVRATTLAMKRHQGSLVLLTADSVLIVEPGRWLRPPPFRAARHDLAALELGEPDRAKGAVFGAVIGGLTMGIILNHLANPRSLGYRVSIGFGASLGALLEAAYPHFKHWVTIPATAVMPGQP